jgi:hypothetical protein
MTRRTVAFCPGVSSTIAKLLRSCRATCADLLEQTWRQPVPQAFAQSAAKVPARDGSRETLEQSNNIQ